MTINCKSSDKSLSIVQVPGCCRAGIVMVVQLLSAFGEHSCKRSVKIFVAMGGAKIAPISTDQERSRAIAVLSRGSLCVNVTLVIEREK